MESFFKDMAMLKPGFAAQIKVICSDMWKPYLKVIAKHLPKAINVLDRFHIMQKFGKAIREPGNADIPFFNPFRRFLPKLFGMT